MSKEDDEENGRLLCSSNKVDRKKPLFFLRRRKKHAEWIGRGEEIEQAKKEPIHLEKRSSNCRLAIKPPELPAISKGGRREDVSGHLAGNYYCHQLSERVPLLERVR